MADDFAHAIAHLATAGGGDERHAFVVQQFLADAAALADHQRKDRRIDIVLFAHLGGDFRTRDRGQRGLAGGFPERAVATGRRDGRVPGPDRDREVKRTDDANHTQRVPLLVHAVVGTFGVHRQAVHLPRKAAGKIADVDHLLHFAFALGDDLAHLGRDQHAEFVLELAQLHAELADKFAALWSGDLAPLDERLVGARDDLVVFIFGDLLDGRDLRAVARRDDVERRPGADPLAAVAAEIRVFNAKGLEKIAHVCTCLKRPRAARDLRKHADHRCRRKPAV